MVGQTDKVLDAVWKAGRVGSWTFVEPLGRGGFGLVVKAKRTHIDGSRQEAAIKLLAHDRAMSPQAQALFNHEFKVLKRLDSPYIAAVLDSGMDAINLGRGVIANVQWIATEHIKGDDLRQEIKAHGPLDKAQWLEFAHDLLSAVKVAHNAAVIHRDIKPDNIMRLSRKSVLIDFGGASFEAELDPGDYVSVYSLGFAAPEQVDGSNPEKLTAAADMFAVGCLLHFAATAGSPWSNDWRRSQDPAAAWYKTITRESPNLDDLDEEQRELISEMIAIGVDERISSSESLSEIEELLPVSSSRSSHGKGYTASDAQTDDVEPEEADELEEDQDSGQEPEYEDFEGDVRQEASSLKPTARSSKSNVEYSTKSFGTTLALATWFGFLGIDRFYLGKPVSGIFKMFTGGGYVFWWARDVKKLLRGDATDGKGLRLRVTGQELIEARKNMKGNAGWLVALIVFLIIVGQTSGGSEPAPTATTVGNLQNAIGMNLSDADELLSGFTLDEIDALGSERKVFIESNWKVCDQSPKGGNLSSADSVTLKVVKLEETCP
jgi:serine/threonine protein kinase